MTVCTWNTVSSGVISVNRSILYDALGKVGVLSLASNTVMVTGTGTLCWTPSEAEIWPSRDRRKEKETWIVNECYTFVSCGTCYTSLSRKGRILEWADCVFNISLTSS